MKKIIINTTKFILLLSNRISVGALLSVTFTCIFGIIFRYFWLSYGITSAEYILSFEYISYVGIVALAKFIFGVILEFFLGDKFFMSIGDNIKIKDIIIMMEGNSNDSSTKQSSFSGSSKESESVDNSGDSYKKDLVKSFDATVQNIKNQEKMVKRLADIKKNKGIQYSSEKGDLSIHVPLGMSSEESKRVASEVGIVDRLLNTYFDEHKELSKKDSDNYSNMCNNMFKDRVKDINDSYKKLFEEN